MREDEGGKQEHILTSWYLAWRFNKGEHAHAPKRQIALVFNGSTRFQVLGQSLDQADLLVASNRHPLLATTSRLERTSLPYIVFRSANELKLFLGQQKSDQGIVWMTRLPSFVSKSYIQGWASASVVSSNSHLQLPAY